AAETRSSRSAIARTRQAPRSPPASSAAENTKTVDRAPSSPASGRVAAQRSREERVEAVHPTRGAEFLAHVGAAHEARDARQRLQMIAAAIDRRDQHEHKISRAGVERVEVLRRLKPGERADRARH